tara:strand:- start:509 stop:1330 length:822 start_codon:yes stop_codon:yes gene_type:complete
MMMSNDNVKVSGHGNVGSNQREILYDPNVAQPNHAEFGQTLVGKASKGTLCTMSAKKEGYPYGSFVIYSMYNNNPIFLFSTLAEHTKNLIRNPKASLLISEDGDGNPLALGRITLVGDCVKLPKHEHESAKEKFLEKHPQSKSYADWNDFSFYQLEVSSIRYIGGFGKMSWVKIDEWVDAEPDPLDHDAIGIIEHMNDDHRDAMVLMCKFLSKAKTTSDAEMTSIDRYGFEMLAKTEQGDRKIRLGFDKEVTTPDTARIALVSLVKKARTMDE